MSMEGNIGYITYGEKETVINGIAAIRGVWAVLPFEILEKNMDKVSVQLKPYVL